MKVTIYKDGEHKRVGSQEAKNLVANDGWSYDAKPTTAVLKKVKPKKAKVKADAEVVNVESPFNDGEPLNIDLGDTNEENK